MAATHADYTDREDDVILYYHSEEDAIDACRRWYCYTDKDIKDGRRLPPILESKKKPGMWYWICKK